MSSSSRGQLRALLKATPSAAIAAFAVERDLEFIARW